MNDSGYKQALANYAYEIDRLMADVEAEVGDDPAVQAVALMSGSEPLLRERAQELDNIITVMANTYHRTEEQIDRDIDAAIQQRVREYS